VFPHVKGSLCGGNAFHYFSICLKTGERIVKNSLNFLFKHCISCAPGDFSRSSSVCVCVCVCACARACILSRCLHLKSCLWSCPSPTASHMASVRQKSTPLGKINSYFSGNVTLRQGSGSFFTYYPKIYLFTPTSPPLIWKGENHRLFKFKSLGAFLYRRV
jgi:hypothetical protein